MEGGMERGGDWPIYFDLLWVQSGFWKQFETSTNGPQSRHCPAGGVSNTTWRGPNVVAPVLIHKGVAAEYLLKEISDTLESYRAKRSPVEEHVSLEEQAEKGGYAHRQIYEVVQVNGNWTCPTCPGPVPW